jgi:hypothetical protein
MLKKRLSTNREITMTLPDERYRSLVHTKKFLVELLSPTTTPRVPRAIRQRAHALLRHWPDDYHLSEMCRALPQHFAEKMEPLHRMVLQQEIARNPAAARPGYDTNCTMPLGDPDSK